MSHTDRREFQFTDGTSNKFWAIKLEGKTFVVHYGRIGTAGQAQEKTFASEDAASAEYKKLIAEKTKKGYAEVSGNTTGASSTATPVPRAPAPQAAPGATPMPAAESAVVIEAKPELVKAKPAPGKIERMIRLKAGHWAWPAWKPAHPARQMQPHPNGFEARWDALKNKTNSSWGVIFFHTLEIPDGVSQEEAWLWINLIRLSDSRLEVKKAEECLTTLRPAPPGTAEDVRTLLLQAEKRGYYIYTHAPQLLRPFFSPLQIASLLIETLASLSGTPYFANYERSYLSFEAVRLYAQHLLPYLDDEARAELRLFLQKAYDDEKDPTSAVSILIINLLAAMGGDPRLVTHVARQADGAWRNRWNCDGNLATLAGLADEVTFVTEARRLLGNILTTPQEVLLWLTATEWRELDLVTTAIKAAGSRDDATALARLLAQVEAPEAAVPMLEVLTGSKAPTVAAAWLTEQVHLAIPGLVPAAMGQGKIAEAAKDHLLGLKRNDRGEGLRAALPHLTETQAAWLQREILDVVEESLPELPCEEVPAPLQEAFAKLKPAKPSVWLSLAALPPIKLAGKRLAPAQIEAVVAALKAVPTDTRSELVIQEVDDGKAVTAAFKSVPRDPAETPLFPLLKELADRNSLDAFAWNLFEQWSAMGAPSKDKWALAAIGHLGGDACVFKLTPLVRAWPGESQHKRAVHGLECLRMVGTDTALMALNGIAQKLKFKALKDKAQSLMEDIASARGLSREQLADRIVPDCGLDRTGGRIFDFGPRQFRFVLGPEMKPLIRDSAGKVRPDLPSPNNSDDPAKAEAAVIEWKLLKKTLREVLKIQAERLEDAMITGRRWSPEEFTTLLAGHPLMVNLIRQLVFALYDEQGRVTQSFRGTEDQGLADSNDDEFPLPATGQIGVVHPAHLDEATKSAWGQILSDYEIIPPFQQLGRPICRPEPDDLEKTVITRFRGPKVPGITMYGILEKSHWLKDIPADGGGFSQHSKYFPSAKVTAFIRYSGLSIGYYDEAQELEEIYFVPGHAKPEMWGSHEKRVAIKDIDLVVVSEVLRLANVIISKAA